jgi:MFS transporter
VLVYALIEAPDEGWLSALTLSLFGVSALLLGLFLWWERRVAEPMLDLGFFRSARFSVGTVAVSIAFFALLGGIFALTQYLQFAHGYSAIEAGAIMSPMALGLVMGAGSSNRAVARIGSARVVTAGLLGVGALLALTLTWDPSTSAGWLLAWFFGLALSMGWVMAPDTEAVVGAVPPARSGVASAMNTVARMVSGALGVAVMGSVVNSVYSDEVSGSLGALPPEAHAAAEESVGAATAIAAQLPPDVGTPLMSAAGNAFADAMGVGLALGAALAVAAAVAVARLLPTSEAAPHAQPLPGAGEAA